MKAMAESEKPVRAPLSRRRVLRAALAYADEYGLEALSMHKLGAALGVKAMSLYKHVADKDDVLDGIVALLWEEIPADPPDAGWREALRWLAGSLRDLVHRHPHAAPLLTSRQSFQQRPLRIAHGILALMRQSGVPEECAIALLRTVFPYGIGYALAELSLPPQPPPGPDRELALIRQVSGLLPAQAPDELVRTALLVCGGCNMTRQFHIGIELMIHGLDAFLGTASAGKAEVPGCGAPGCWSKPAHGPADGRWGSGDELPGTPVRR